MRRSREPNATLASYRAALTLAGVLSAGCSPWAATPQTQVVLQASTAKTVETRIELPAKSPSPKQVFDQRILPIFKSPDPSSCVQCHLAGVDLKKYIQPSHEKTFLSLRDQGLIDLEQPEQSKILKLINMREGDNAGADLLYAPTRQAEYEAFAVWIKACCADPNLRSAQPLPAEERTGPDRPVEVIRHGRKDRLLESFERNVWAWRFRCMTCHTEGSPQCDKLVQEHGKRVAWVKKAGARETMEHLLASRLIDAEQPDRSLLIQKPLGEVKHEGGKKFLIGDQAHKGFRSWVEDVAALRADRYVRVEDLPPKQGGSLRFGSDLWLKLLETPPEWADRLLQVEVYAWDAATKAWEAEPIATSDRGVWGKGRLWQHNLTLLATPGSARAKTWTTGTPTLPSGRYRLKVYVDRDGRLARDWKAMLGESDCAGSAEFDAVWHPGYGAMTQVDARSIKP